MARYRVLIIVNLISVIKQLIKAEINAVTAGINPVTAEMKKILIVQSLINKIKVSHIIEKEREDDGDDNSTMKVEYTKKISRFHSKFIFKKLHTPLHSFPFITKPNLKHNIEREYSIGWAVRVKE